MILGYRDRRTERFAGGRFARDFQGFEDRAAKRLAIPNAAPSLDTLRTLPSNRLEALGGDRRGQYSIATNVLLRHLLHHDGPAAEGTVDAPGRPRLATPSTLPLIDCLGIARRAPGRSATRIRSQSDRESGARIRAESRIRRQSVVPARVGARA